MKELQAALKGFTQKNETLKLETKVRLREVLVTFTCMLHLIQVNSVVAKYRGGGGGVPRECFNRNKRLC